MRLWSIHPEYLDSRGLVALWREALLAKKVLEGHTNGYRHHPQLTRFRAAERPLLHINVFLGEVYKEAVLRGYRFDKTKITPAYPAVIERIPVTIKQLYYEFALLQSKLEKRSPQKYQANLAVANIAVNGVFIPVEGEIEAWEKIRGIPETEKHSQAKSM